MLIIVNLRYPLTPKGTESFPQLKCFQVLYKMPVKVSTSMNTLMNKFPIQIKNEVFQIKSYKFQTVDTSLSYLSLNVQNLIQN